VPVSEAVFPHFAQRTLNALDIRIWREPTIDIFEYEQLAVARAHFLHVRLQFFEQTVIRRDCNHRHLLVEQREWTMLQFTGGVAFGAAQETAPAQTCDHKS
jgi:hypothetical protein